MLPVDPVPQDLLFLSLRRSWDHDDRTDDRLSRNAVPLVILHVGRERSSRVVAAIADGALEGFHVIVCLHVDLQVIGSRKGGLTVRAAVPLVPGVQLDMAISTPLVLEEPLTVVAVERHLIRVDLLRIDGTNVVRVRRQVVRQGRGNGRRQR